MVGAPKDRPPLGDDDLEPHFTPQMLVDHFRRAWGFSSADIRTSRLVVGALAASAVNRLLYLAAGQLSRFQLAATPRTFEGVYSGQEVCIVSMPAGAPWAAMTLEEYIVRGGESFIFVGAAGSLQPDLRIGSVVIPTECVVDEGTSQHYLPPKVASRPSQRLLALLDEACQQKGIPFRQGPNWSTDAPYRELKADIHRHQRAGVLSVDMETSALFSVAMHRAVEAAVILVISDELFRPWEPGFFTAAFNDSLARVCEAALEAIIRA